MTPRLGLSAGHGADCLTARRLDFLNDQLRVSYCCRRFVEVDCGLVYEWALLYICRFVPCSGVQHFILLVAFVGTIFPQFIPGRTLLVRKVPCLWHDGREAGSRPWECAL